MITGDRPVKDIWSTRDAFSAVGPIKESMTEDAFKDLCRCMHFTYDWEDGQRRMNQKALTNIARSSVCWKMGTQIDGKKWYILVER